MYFIDEQAGWVVGNVILKTTNGGLTWSRNYNESFGSNKYKDVHFIDQNTGWIVGESGAILNTTDSGETWTLQPSGTSSTMESIFFTDDQTGWAVGVAGHFLGTKTGGIVRVQGNDYFQSRSPREFTLSQNYPNPFNQSTKITYTIPVSDFVKLKIYDIWGREIKTLVSEFQKVGTYSVCFYARGNTSSIYFYRLEAGNFVETKKMVLTR